MERGDRFRNWLQIAVTFMGVTLYTLISKGQELAPADLATDASLAVSATITGEAAALMRFYAAVVLSEIAAFATIVVTISLLVMYVERADLRFHFSILFALILASLTLNIFAPSPITEQFSKIICHKEVVISNVSFCAISSKHILNNLPSPVGNLDFYQIVFLGLCVASACIGYIAFVIGITGSRRDRASREEYERAIALIVTCGGVMLVFWTLAVREYGRWAFSGVVTNQNTEAFIGGITIYAGATASSLLAMIWLFAIGLLIVRPYTNRGLLRHKALSQIPVTFGFISILAPTLLAVLQNLFYPTK